MAVYCNQQGLLAASLVLPTVLDVGLVAENDAIETPLTRKGLYNVDEQEMLRGFEAAMSQRQDRQGSRLCDGPQLIMGMEVNKIADTTGKAGSVGQADICWYHGARFCHLRASFDARDTMTGVGGSGVDDFFAVALKAALAQIRQAALEAIVWHIYKQVSGILLVPDADFTFGLRSPFQKLLAPTLTFLELARQAG
ncbi:hypothetical protein F5883DRAFT_637687 [Diaporthe sp. PMI_573]|nr:hypothetical protein F5883DRAFT_637687 [Diaporthaceae sp. PMI_573]